MLVLLSQPSLIDIGISAFIAVAVIVWSTAGRAFAIVIGMIIGVFPRWGIGVSFLGSAIAGRPAVAAAACADNEYE